MHPYLFHFGSILLPTFGLLAALGLMAALWLSTRTAPLNRLSPDPVWNAGLFLLLSAFVLSRVLLILANLNTFFNYPFLFLSVPSLTPTGLLLTTIATLVYLRLKKLPILPLLDTWAPCATLVWAFLALGHLAEGSDPGLITSVPWAIPSPTGLSRLHPVALYAAAAALALTVILWRHLHRPHRVPGATAALALASAGIAQFLISFFRQPDLDNTGLLDPLQWVALAMVLAAGLLYLVVPQPALTRTATEPHAV